DPPVVEAPDVAHPVAVDVRVVPGRRPDELSPFGPFGLRLDPRGRVAALFAQGANRVDRFRVVPRPRLEAIVPRRDRTDRTDVHQVPGQERVHPFFLEGRDLAAVAAIDD